MWKIKYLCNPNIMRPAFHCPNGGIGRRVGLKIQCPLKTCRFEPGFGHRDRSAGNFPPPTCLFLPFLPPPRPHLGTKLAIFVLPITFPPHSGTKLAIFVPVVGAEHLNDMMGGEPGSSVYNRIFPEKLVLSAYS